MPSIVGQREPVEQLAEEFLARFRRGERPAITEYTTAHPELADEIREVFPALVMMEQVGADAACSDNLVPRQVTSDGRGLERVGEFRIIREIGRGGMGVVYEAEQDSLGRHVALKVLPFHATLAPHHLERFRREASVAAQLHHSNIVPVFGVGEDRGVHYFAMQYIPGQALDEVVVELQRLRNVAVKLDATSRARRHADGDSANRAASLARAMSDGGFIVACEHEVLSAALTPPALRRGFNGDCASGAFAESRAEAVEPLGQAQGRLSQLAPTIELPQQDSDVQEGSEECRPISSKAAAAEATEKEQPPNADSREVRQYFSNSSETSPRSATSEFATSSTGNHYYASVARIGMQVAEALAYAHQQGVLHRDIKPANLLLDGKGTVWVTDFGLAKSVTEKDVTGTGDIIGTLRYMAPERFNGWCDPRSDIYSLGLALYELLALQPAFEELDHGLLIQRILHDEPTRPRKLDPRIPRDLETITLKAAAKEPSLRYQTAGELAEDLRRFLADKPIQARRSSMMEQLWRWCRRNRLAAGLVVSVALLLLVVAVGSSVTSLRLRGLLSRAEKAEDEVRERLREVQRTELERTRQLAESLLHQARAQRWSARVGQRFESLRGLAQAGALARELGHGPDRLRELRNEAIACLALPDIRLTHEWAGYPPGSRSGVAFDREGRHYARSTEQAISVRRVSDDAEVASLPGPGSNANHLLFSPDGSRLAALYARSFADRGTNFVVWDWRRREMAFAAPVRVEQFALDFSADGRRIAFAQERSRRVFLHDLETGRELVTFLAAFVPFRLAFDPRDEKLAVAGAGLQLHDAATGTMQRPLEIPDRVYSVAWDASGERLVATCGQNIGLWNARTGERLGTLTGHQGTVTVANFNRRGDFVQSSSWDGTARLWEVATARQVLVLPSGSSSRNADWESSGLFERTGTSLRHWEVALGREYRLWSDFLHPHGAETPCLSPDGRWLALATGDGVQIFDVAEEQKKVSLNLGRTLGVVFHPTGDSLFTSGTAGVQRWPMTVENGVPKFGPAEKLALTGAFQRVDVDAGGRLLAVAGGNQAHVWNLDRKQFQIPPLVHGLAVFVKFHPDGRCFVTSPWNGRGVKVWDTSTGRLVRDLLPDADIASIAFRPDGRWLVTVETHRACVWDTETWQLAHEFPTSSDCPVVLSFSLDGRLVALPTDPHTLELRDTDTWASLATLQTPWQDRIGWMKFAPDENQLLVGVGSPQRIRAWNLRLIREQLAELGLDWNSPPSSLPPNK